MTIHHDKLAYGKIAAASKELSDEDILIMLDEINEATNEADKSDLSEQPSEQKIIKK